MQAPTYIYIFLNLAGVWYEKCGKGVLLGQEGGALQKNSAYINTSKNKVHAIFIFELNDSKSADQSSTPLDYNGIEIRR